MRSAVPVSQSLSGLSDEGVCMEAHVARAIPRTHFLDGQCSHADRRNISLIDDGGMPEGVFGLSVDWQDVLKRATRVAATEATTCLQGESGTGKEVVARFIDRRSPRCRGQF